MEKMVEKARRVALMAHKGQVDQAGVAYHHHPERVAARVEGEDAKTVAWLHDVVEDTKVTRDDLLDCGFPQHVVDAVTVLSKNKGQSLDAYYQGVKANPLALAVKLADVADNSDPARLALLPVEKQQRLLKKYHHAQEVLNG